MAPGRFGKLFGLFDFRSTRSFRSKSYLEPCLSREGLCSVGRIYYGFPDMLSGFIRVGENTVGFLPYFLGF